MKECLLEVQVSVCFREFKEIKRKPVVELSDCKWPCDFEMVDMTKSSTFENYNVLTRFSDLCYKCEII